MVLPKIGTTVTFGRRRGYVRGYTTVDRQAYIDTHDTYLVVELDHESQAYLEAREGYADHDCFITLMLIHPENARLLQ